MILDALKYMGMAVLYGLGVWALLGALFLLGAP